MLFRSPQADTFPDSASCFHKPITKALHTTGRPCPREPARQSNLCRTEPRRMMRRHAFERCNWRFWTREGVEGGDRTSTTSMCAMSSRMTCRQIPRSSRVVDTFRKEGTFILGSALSFEFMGVQERLRTPGTTGVRNCFCAVQICGAFGSRWWIREGETISPHSIQREEKIKGNRRSYRAKAYLEPRGSPVKPVRWWRSLFILQPPPSGRRHGTLRGQISH